MTRPFTQKTEQSLVTQQDPIGIAGGLNLYGYAAGDPINFSDPFGLCPKPWSPTCIRAAAEAVNRAAWGILETIAKVEAAVAGFLLPGPEEYVIGPVLAQAGRLGFNLSSKISRQLGSRGWTSGNIDDLINSPHATRDAVNKATGGKATAYFNADGSYVVRDNATEDIIQISNRNDPDWIPDSSIRDPYRSGG